jgi:hypothetical protein
VEVVGGFLPIAMLIMEVRGGYLLPREWYMLNTWSTVYSWARAPPSHYPAFWYLSRQAIFLNLMGWKIGPSCHLAYANNFWALVQSKSHIAIIFNENKNLSFST